MSRYISVYMDNGISNFKNVGLYDIIIFIGEQKIKEHNNKTIKDVYKEGKKVINSRLNKWHLTAIERLVVADIINCKFNYEQKTIKPVWKVHRSKAKNIFDAIYCILKKYDNREIVSLFNLICERYDFILYPAAIGMPYYEVIRDKELLKAQNYDVKEIICLTSCAKEIEKFSRIK